MCLVNHDTKEPIETKRKKTGPLLPETGRGENLIRQAGISSRSEKTAVKKLLARLLQSDTPSDGYKDAIIEIYQALETEIHAKRRINPRPEDIIVYKD